MLNKRFMAAAVLTVAVFAAAPASAGLIPFEFAGVIDTVSDPDNALDGAVQVGDPFSGSYTFDSDTPDSYPGDPGFGQYQSHSFAINIAGGGLAVDAGPDDSQILVSNETYGDQYSSGAFGFESSGVGVNELEIRLADNTATAFDSDALPVTPPELSAFSWRTMFFNGVVLASDLEFNLYGTVTSLVPEPTVLLLLVAGMPFIPRRAQRR